MNFYSTIEKSMLFSKKRLLPFAAGKNKLVLHDVSGLYRIE